MGALAALALLLLAGGRKSPARVSPPTKRPVPQDKTDAPAASDKSPVDKAVDDFGNTAAFVGPHGGGAAALGKTVLEVFAAAGAATGVAAGFLLVTSLWAVVLVGGIIMGKLMAPEMTKRATWPKLWSAETGSLPWRLGRAMWVRLVLQRMPGAGSADSLRWPELDTGYGELTVQGYLEFILRPGETVPQAARDREDFYGGLEWFNARLKQAPAPAELLNIVARARQVAQAYATGVCFGAAACGRVSGERLNDPLRCENLWAEGLGLLGAASDEQGASDGSRESETELSAAFLAGCRDGVDWSRRVAYGFAGEALLKPEMARAVSLQLAAWATFYGPTQVTDSGELVMLGGRYTPFGADAPAVSVEVVGAVKPPPAAVAAREKAAAPTVEVVGAAKPSASSVAARAGAAVAPVAGAIPLPVSKRAVDAFKKAGF